MNDSHEHEQVDRKTQGVKVIPGDQLDPNTRIDPIHRGVWTQAGR